MANTANSRARFAVDLFADSNSTLASGTPLTLVCNREYDIIDYAIAVTAAAGNEANEQIIVEISGGAQQANVTGLNSLGWKRPAVLTVGIGDAGLLPAAAVARGSTLRVRALSTAGTLGATVRFNGTLTVCPGNRYKVGVGTYYPNNTTTGAQGTSATQSI